MKYYLYMCRTLVPMEGRPVIEELKVTEFETLKELKERLWLDRLEADARGYVLTKRTVAEVQVGKETTDQEGRPVSVVLQWNIHREYDPAQEFSSEQLREIERVFGDMIWRRVKEEMDAWRTPGDELDAELGIVNVARRRLGMEPLEHALAIITERRWDADEGTGRR